LKLSQFIFGAEIYPFSAKAATFITFKSHSFFYRKTAKQYQQRLKWLFFCTFKVRLIIIRE